MRADPYLWILLLSTFIVSCVAHAAPEQSVAWRLAFEDNFSKPKPDPYVWSRIPQGPSDWNKHMSTDMSLFDIKDGKLILIGKKTDIPNETRPFITGGVMTKGKLNMLYGKVEVCVKLEGAKGAWPAIWMMPESRNGAWPMCGEIDIMERLNYDDFVYQTVHSHYANTLGMGNNPPKGGRGKIKPDDYNVYGVEWYPEKLVFLVNGKETFTYPRIETDKEGQFPWNVPFYLMIDMQLGGSWVGAVEIDQLPVKMYVDWVRMYTGTRGTERVGTIIKLAKKRTKRR